jgi:hypothetical protein
MVLRGPTQATASAGPQRVEDQLGRYRVTFGCILPVSGEVKGGSRLHKGFGGIETNGRLTEEGEAELVLRQGFGIRT